MPDSPPIVGMIMGYAALAGLVCLFIPGMRFHGVVLIGIALGIVKLTS